MRMREGGYGGVLCIGDPHLASRVPGFRRDDYPRAILEKLRWCLTYAKTNRLLPVILGDLFHYPQDNANWLLVELLDLLKVRVLGIAGNHDCNENSLMANDTLSIIHAAGHIHLLDRGGVWAGEMNGMRVVVGGTCWGQRLPKTVEVGQWVEGKEKALVVWVAHHDVRFPGYEEGGRFGCYEIPGVDVLVNGHIHRPMEDVVCGGTTWVNPGNITRVSRSDGSRNRKPGVLRIDVGEGGWRKERVEVPHRPFEEVFHAEVAGDDVKVDDSLFIRGLAQLESLKTESGAGLRAFLKDNLHQFDEPVANEIRALAEEVLENGE